MFEIEDLFDLTLEGAFANKEEFFSFAKDATNEELFSLMTPGAFKNSDELSSFLVKKKDEPDMESVSEPGSSVSPESSSKPLAVVDKEIQVVSPFTADTSEEDIEASVLAGVGANLSDYYAWKQKNVRPESRTFKFMSEILLPEEGVKFERQETVNNRVNQYLASKLNEQISDLDPVIDKGLIDSLLNQNAATRQQIIRLLPDYEKEAVLDEREDRRKLLENLQTTSGAVRSNIGQAGKSFANNIQRYAMGTAASLAQKADAYMNLGGADKKGFWAGMTDMLLDASQHYSMDLGETARPVFIEGKKVTHRGKNYLVDKGVIYDYGTHIRVDDLINQETANTVFAKADKVQDTETDFSAGAGLSGISGQLANLYALIRTGKSMGIGPKAGMGVASYTSTVAQNIEDIKQDLMAQGMSEQEATNIGLGFGQLTSTFDGVFSALAGGNQKLLPGYTNIKKQLVDLAKTKGSEIGKKQFMQKGRELIRENAQELFVEEIPVLISERLANDAINYVSELNARDGIETLGTTDFLDTAFLTIGSTTTLGAPNLLSKNDRNSTLRSLARSNRDFSKVAEGLIAEGMISREEADVAIQEIDNFRLAERKTAGAIVGTENMLDAAELIAEKDNLIKERENMDPALRGPIDKKIEALDQQLKEIQQRDQKEVEEELGRKSEADVEVTGQEALAALRAEGITNPTVEQLVAKSDELMEQKMAAQPKQVTREEALASLKEENATRQKMGLNAVLESEENIKKEQQKLQQNAIQEQEARDIPDAESTEGVQEVEEEVREPVVEEKKKEDYSKRPIVVRSRPKTATEEPVVLSGVEAEAADRTIEKIVNDGVAKGQSTQEILDRILPRYAFNDLEINNLRDFIEGKSSGKTKTDFASYKKGAPVTEQEAVEQKPIAKTLPLMGRGRRRRATKTQINVAEDGTLVSVVNQEGQEVSSGTRKKAERQFLTQDLDVNSKPRIDQQQGMTQEQYTDAVIEQGENIKELVEVIDQVQQEMDESVVDNPLLDQLEGRKFSFKSWQSMTGQSQGDIKDKRRNWLRKDGESIEDLENMQEAIDFINANPTAADVKALKQADPNFQDKVTRLKQRFEALTGIKATNSNLNVVRQIDPNRPPIEVITPQVEAQKEMEAEAQEVQREEDKKNELDVKEFEGQKRAEQKQQEARDNMSNQAVELEQEMLNREETPSIKEVIDRSYEQQVSNQDANIILKTLGYTEQEIRDYRNDEQKLYKPVKTKLGKIIPGVDNILDYLNKAQKWLRSARRFFPKNVFLAKEKRDAMIAAEIDVAERLAKKLNKKMEGQSQEVYDQLNEFMNGGKIDNIPMDVLDIALQMRTHIDRLSQMLIDTGVVSNEDSIENIENNLGAYINRSYRVFDDPNYAEQVPEQIINQAKEYLRKQYYNDENQLNFAFEQAALKNMTVEQWIEQRVDQEVNRIIKGQESSDFIKGATTGRKNLAALKERKNIPPEIRALMGEYGDPAFNYVMSVAKITQMVESQKFLSSVRDAGLGSFLFEEGDVDMPDGYERIASEGNAALDPLDGLYGPPEFVNQMKEGALFNINNKGLETVYKVWATLVGGVKKAKTIYSVATHSKNVLGNLFLMAQNGYVNPKEYNNAFKLLKNDLFGKTDEEANKKLDEYKRLGIINQSVQLNEIKEMLGGDTFDANIKERVNKQDETQLSKIKRFVSGKGKNIDNFLQDLYQAEDDLFKIVSFEHDKKNYADIMFDKKYEDLTDNERRQVDERVAENIKNILPNYSRLGGLAKVLRTFPVAGTFISFQLEAYRTSVNTAKLAFDELKSDNPKMAKKGAQRLASLALFQGIKTAIYKNLATFALDALGGEDEEEEGEVEDVRPFLADYRKNSDLAIFDAGDGKFSYIDLTASDPYGGIHQAFNAFSRGRNADGSIKEGFEELFSPFDGDILFKTFQNLTNTDEKGNLRPLSSYGQPLTGADKTDAEEFFGILNEIFKTFEPGTVSSIRKADKAFEKEGLKGLGKESLGQFFGYKPYEVDVAKQFSFKLKDYSEEIRDVKKIKSRAKYAGKRTGDFSQVIEAYKQTPKMMRPIYKDMNRDVMAAMKLGVPMYKIVQMLKNRGFSKLDRAYILFYNELPELPLQ